MRALTLALAVLAAPSFAAEPAALFESHGCRSCHKLGARGGNAGPDLTMVGHRRPKAWLLKWLHSPRAFKPGTKMPEQGLTVGDRGALAAFLSAQKGQAWTRKPWHEKAGTARGRMIYSRAGCVACHGPAGSGGHPNPNAHGGVIPALAPLMSTYTKTELIAKLRRGVVPEVHDGPPAEVDMPGWEGALDDGELDALADYLLILAKTDPKDEF